MALTWHDVDEGIRDAQFTVRQFQKRIDSMAGLVMGNLKSGKVTPYILASLKRELRNFNMNTGKWKE